METNNPERLQSVQLRGIVRNQPQQKANDGDCEDLINLRHQDGAWRGVGSKTKLSYSIVTERIFSRVIKPSMLPDGFFIGYSPTTESLYLIETSGTSTSTETLIYAVPEGAEFVDLAWMNNTMLAYLTNDVVAFQYLPSEEEFITLGNMIMPKIAIGEQDALQDIEVSGSIATAEGTVDEMSQAYFDGIRSEFFETYSQKMNEGYFMGNVSFFFAYKMFDGSYIKHSGPFVWNVAWDKSKYPMVERTYYAEPNDPPIPYGAAIWTITASLGRPTVYMEYAGETGDFLQNYKQAGLIQSLCVFMSSARSGWDIFEEDVNKWTFLSSVHQYTPPFDAEAFKSVPDAINHYLVKEIGIDELIEMNTATGVKRVSIILDRNQLSSIETNPALPVDSFSHHKLIPSVTYLYNSRLHLGDISIYPGGMQSPFIDWFYDSIAEEYILPTERDEDLTENFFGEGFSIVEDNSTILDGYNFFLHVEIDSDGNTYQKTISLSLSDIRLFSKVNVEPVIDYYVCIRPLSAYPDLRAKKWMLLCQADVDTHMKICEAEIVEGNGVFELKPRTFSNTAMYNGSMQEFDTETYLPIWIRVPADPSTYNSLVNYDSPLTYSHNWKERNRIQVSEVNNVMFYPSKQSYRVGNPDYTIRAMIVAQEPMTEMQFGQFPLYAFTAGGVFALEYAGGGEVLYSRISQFLTDIINEGVQPMALSGGAIVYQEQSAVKVLIGRESKSISREVIAQSKNPVYDQELLSRITTDERISDVRVILESGVTQSEAMSLLLNSRIGFDHLNEEILFSRLSTDPFLGEGSFTLVYQLKSGAWYKRSEIFRDYIRMTGGYYGMINTVTLDSEENETYTIDFYKLSEENYPESGEISDMKSPWVYAQTRPMSLGSGFHKKLIQAIARFQGCNVKDMQTITRTTPQFGLLYNLPAVLEVVPDVTDGLELTFDDIANVPVADASSVNDWNTFFDLPTNGTPFTSVVVDGDKVTLIGGANIHLKNDLFYLGGYTYNETLLSVIDTNSVVSAGNKCFNYCNRLTRLEFPVMTTAGEYTFQLVDWDNPNVCILVFPSLEEIGTYCFAECLSVTEFDFPQLTTSASYGFAYNTSAVSFNFPLLSPLGGSSGDDSFFTDITFKTIALTVPASAMTCNGGNPDGDIEYLQSFNTVTITTV